MKFGRAPATKVIFYGDHSRHKRYPESMIFSEE
jgi:hypothetical protein